MIKAEWILHIVPDAKFSLTGESYEGLEWRDDRLKPSEQDILDAKADYEASKKEKEDKKAQYRQEIKGTKPPQSNPELAERVEKIEYLLGLHD